MSRPNGGPALVIPATRSTRLPGPGADPAPRRTFACEHPAGRNPSGTLSSSARARRRARSPSARTARGTCARRSCSRLSIVPRKQPRKPSGIETMPGLASVPADRRAGHGVGARPHLRARRSPGRSTLTTPNSTPVIAPVVLKRRQVSASSSAGKFALAATANARPTMNETFRPEPPMTAMTIAITPIANAAILRDHDLLVLGVLALADDRWTRCRARPRPTPSSTRPGDDREDRRERDAGDDAPGTGRRRTCPRRRRGTAARFGAARLPPLPAASTPALAQERARAEADERRQQVEEADQEHRPARPSRAPPWRSGTVKNRIRMCGRPAVPSTSARPSETVSIGLGRNVPGPSENVDSARRVRVGAVEQLDRVEADLAEHEDRHHERCRPSAARP